VAQGADVNVRDNAGRTPLCCAAVEGHMEVVATLGELGADVNVQDTNGWTPLHQAAYHGHVELVATIVQHGADVNVQDTGGLSPLHRAAYHGHVEVVATLVQHGADVNVQNTYGQTPLHQAADCGHVEVVTTLVEHEADIRAITMRGNTALHCAGTAAVVTLLLEAGLDLHRRNNMGNTPLYEVIHLGHVSAVTALVQAGARPEASDGEWWNSLLVGAVTGDEAAMTELIAASEELTGRMDEDGQLARTAKQLALLCTHYRRQEVIATLTVPQP
jgi:ankyrin repeat protein